MLFILILKIKENFQSVDHLQNQDILQFYINQWKKYRISSKILHGICSYLHRHYVRRAYNSGDRDICEIYSVRDICSIELAIIPNYHL